MSLSVIAYNNLQVVPYKLMSLQELTLTKKMNDHARLYFTGIVPEDVKDDYVKMTESNTVVEINQLDEQGNPLPLFKGIVLTIEVKTVRDVYYIEVEAASHTYHLDVKRNNRSFQNKEMTYATLFQQVGAAYPGIDIIDEASKGAALGNFTMQYRETDWQFLKRMASRFNTGLVPATTFDKPKFHFGVSEGSYKGKLEDYHYITRKKIADYLIYTKNGNQGIEENDFIYYEVETNHVLEIGDCVSFKEESLFVCEGLTSMKEGLLKHLYTLSSKEGMNQRETYNESVIGLSVEGKVIEVAKDHVKIHLNIDETQDKGEAHWFLYSTVYTAEGHSGWYCMPEIDDYVHVYFPTDKEEDGIASSSIRKNLDSSETNKLDDPTIKYFRNAFGKELMMSPTEIVITAKDGDIYIRLNEENGIEIFSKKEIKIISDADISVNSGKKILMSAAEEISLTCKESKIIMDGSVKIFGKEVKAN
ncbi:contractile injection system protein, VgrG/Pvc8 family [Sporosarcina limicola]|uniref:Gp5/Type VI secretion system Vgr protein OB-fold domain-containing protein n=1 Tax=Sporosarcina limicola TaxID=34101 RepID=A0A927ML45_9BACL|nr:contractile injection system protein, VgrG/Pvc8 family [Sporosarcina limicola]MBE1555943.1 hypothetical protein [Sporosarcina limicola]